MNPRDAAAPGGQPGAGANIVDDDKAILRATTDIAGAATPRGIGRW